jgi:hypothetical protein
MEHLAADGAGYIGNDSGFVSTGGGTKALLG